MREIEFINFRGSQNFFNEFVSKDTYFERVTTN